LLRAISEEPWLGDLKRRVQHYGYRYDYKARKIDSSMKIGEVPAWTAFLTDKFRSQGHFIELPDQLIVNEYEPGQGIAKHVDCQSCFTDTILSLSLGSSCVMTFTHLSSQQVVPVFLEPQSLVIRRGESRYEWQHSIAGRKSDTHEGKSYPRGKRVSLTFRKVIL